MAELHFHRASRSCQRRSDALPPQPPNACAGIAVICSPCITVRLAEEGGTDLLAWTPGFGSAGHRFLGL